jgi:Flp pilus assembly protein TadD
MQIHAPRLIILASLALALGACGHEGAPEHLAAAPRGSERQLQSATGAAALLQKAGELRASGRLVQALSVLADAHQRYPEDGALASTYGRVALLLGHDEVAAPLLAQAVEANSLDWRALSAQGVLAARRGRLPDGRRALAKASMVSASEVVILNNLAVSQLLDGRPAAAVSLLRQGLAAPQLRTAHERRLRRNLALALAMQGRFAEAERLAGEKLPRDLAEGGTARLRRLLGVSEPQLAAETGWSAQYVAASHQEGPALR